jgi:transposase, IS5 family
MISDGKSKKIILKHMHNLSDEAPCDRWVENPYFQCFCGDVVFRHELPFDRWSLTRWRRRLGEEQIAALLQESLSVAHRTKAIATKYLERVLDTVQEKAIAYPSIVAAKDGVDFADLFTDPLMSYSLH